ncbi:MAG: aldehyde reductase [Saprospiraceae bacterium]|nr:aldehyde reductase [Saprospiraceae bacterium]
MDNQTVLLTGVTGFLGAHTAIQLLNKGCKVIGTLRDMRRAESIKQVIAAHTTEANRLQLVEADLLDASVWYEITKGVDYVFHMASPFPRVLPKNDDELLLPARNGTLYVLKAAAANGVKRVVLTSSSGAITYGVEKSRRNSTFTENDWTDPNNTSDTSPYFRSKTLAERAAWDFMEKDNSGMELVTICPGAILGPVLEQDFGTTANIVIKTLDGSTPAIPRIGYDISDARSVADLHIRAMQAPQAAGQRFIAATDYLRFKDVADILRETYPQRKIPTLVLPDVGVRLFSYIDPVLKPLLIDLGVERRLDNSKAVRELGWQPIPAREAVLACAESVIALKLV